MIKSSSLDSLESHENKLQPKPGQRQHDDHVWEGETEPGSKVDDISVLRKKSRENRKSSIGRDKQAVTVAMEGGTHWFICPFSTRLGPVPVSVAVPPMLAA